MTASGINTTGVQFVCDHLAHIPRPDLEVKARIKAWLQTHDVQLDPDQIEVVTLHVHPRRNDTTLAVIVQRVSLVQAVLMNWQGESDNNVFGSLFHEPWAGTLPQGTISIVNALPPPPFNVYGDWYSTFNGLFLRTEEGRYDHSTLIPLPAETLQSHIEEMDFHTQYKALLDSYWQDHLDSYRLASKVNLIAACNKQVSEGSLSDDARRNIWRAAELMPRGKGLQLSTLNIYGYVSTDLLLIKDMASDLCVLYVPGNSSPLLEFKSEDTMKDWVGQQCKDPAKRQALKQHFRLADGPLGEEFCGLDIALEGLGLWPKAHRLSPNAYTLATSGFWPPREYVNYRPDHYDSVIVGDVFLALAELQKQRSKDDAGFIITSNSEVNKRKWRNYLNATLTLIAPLTLVVPGLAGLLALGGIVQLGLGLDEVINGKHLEDKQQGLEDVAWGLFNALPLAIKGTSRAKALFKSKRDFFVLPSRVNGQIGYPLSPVDVPHLPEIQAPQPPEIEVARFFIADNAIPPLPDADPATAGAVIRTNKFNGKPDKLTASIEGYTYEMFYDVERDEFIPNSDENHANPTGYIAHPGTRNLQAVMDQRPVTNGMRVSTLRALGVDLPLPAEIPTLSEGSTPIPKKISSLWVGNHVIDDALIHNLAANAAHLEGSEYTLRLFLSNASPQSYADNLRLLSEQAPGLQVLPLEEQEFFRAFRDNHPRRFSQYQAALDGNGGVATNYSSASDVLRYPMLYHEGGLYMDVDDSLFARQAGDAPPAGDQAPLEHIDQVPLRTTPEGLLLAQPMSNQALGMNYLYNTSLIGSHAGNPTLEAISEEMYNRYQTDLEFYNSRPNQQEDPEGFYNYTNRLSRLTGPALLTDVVDQRLPPLARMRQVTNLCALPHRNSWQFIDLNQYRQSLRELLPLDRFARVGNNNSWRRS